MNKMKTMLLCLLCAAAVRTYSLQAQTKETTAKIISDFVNKDLPVCLYVTNFVQYPVIYEFFNGQFKMVLPYNEYRFCYIISADARKKNIELKKYKDHKSYTITVRWNSDKLMYEQE